MILPSKHILDENALIGVGADILGALDDAKTVSVLFYDTQNARAQKERARIHFDWFLLALDFLFTINAIRFDEDLLRKRNQ